MARAKNSATEEDIRKCLKGELDTLDPAKFNADTEDVVEHYCVFIKSLLKLTPRPNVSVLSKAAQKAFLKAEPDTCKKWAQSICNAIQHCRKKVKSMKSGSKLTPGVKCICDVLKKGNADVGSSPQPSKAAALPLQATSKRVLDSSPSASRVLKPNFSVSSSEPTPIKKARSTLLLTPPPGTPKPPSGASSSKAVVHISDSPVKQKAIVEWLDRATMEMKRRSPDGVIVATMEEGPDGFLLYRFPNVDAKATEVPNYTYQVFKNKKAMKKPAAACKAKAVAKKPAAMEAVIDSVEEEKIPEQIPPAAEANEEKPADPKVISMHLTKAKDKTYIQAKLEKSSGKKLLCNLQSSTSQQHLEIMLEVMTWGQNLPRTYPNSTFEDMKFSLLQHRDKLLAEARKGLAKP